MSARFCSKLTSSSSGCEKTPQTCTVCVKKTAHLEQIRGARWGKDGFFGDLIGVLQEVPDGHDPALQPGLAAGGFMALTPHARLDEQLGATAGGWLTWKRWDAAMRAGGAVRAGGLMRAERRSSLRWKRQAWWQCGCACAS